eukprot:GCRY01001333.1.p1 GENE.GCRY01001333.1~~GCRY01001333.1.p1  ORF type:complete len:203 (+),score=40.00 GCRY01001333.1:153-761(+)
MSQADLGKKHRTRWNPRVPDPKPQHFFLPTAIPLRPATKETPIAYVKVEEAPKEVLTTPPPEALVDGAFCIRDRMNDYRGYISPDGQCFNNCSECIGFIEVDSGEAGSSEMEFLGSVVPGNAPDELFALNAAEEMVATVDLGRALVRDMQGATLCEFSNAGEVKGNWGSYLGQFEPFSYHDLKAMAMYLTLIDPGMLCEVEG